LGKPFVVRCWMISCFANVLLLNKEIMIEPLLLGQSFLYDTQPKKMLMLLVFSFASRGQEKGLSEMRELELQYSSVVGLVMRRNNDWKICSALVFNLIGY
jgi:hypothetical protein